MARRKSPLQHLLPLPWKLLPLHPLLPPNPQLLLLPTQLLPQPPLLLLTLLLLPTLPRLPLTLLPPLLLALPQPSNLLQVLGRFVPARAQAPHRKVGAFFMP